MALRFRSTRQTRALFAAFLDRPGDWHYGYDLSRATGLKSGTLYPLLMRFADRGWVESRWTESDIAGRPPRHIYRITAEGRAAAAEAADAPSARLEPSIA